MQKPLHKFEWIILILLALCVDVVQILLNIFFGSGILFNRFISLAASIIFNGYLWFRGKEVISGKQFINALATMAGEQIPIADILPIWTISLIASYLIEKAELKPESALGRVGSGIKKINTVANKVTPKAGAKITAGKPPIITQTTQRINIKPPPLNVNGIRPPQKN